MEVISRRDCLGVDLHTYQVVLVLHVRHRERQAHLDLFRCLRLLRRFRRVARSTLCHAETRQFVAVHVHHETTTRLDGDDDATVGGGGVDVEGGAVVAALGLCRGDVLVGSLGPGIDEVRRVPVLGRVLCIHLVAPLGGVVVEHQREEGLLLVDAQHREALDDCRAGGDLHVACPRGLRVVVEDDLVVGGREAVGVVDGGIVVLEALVLAQHLLRVQVDDLVVHVATVIARFRDVHVGQLLSHAAFRDVDRHHGGGGLAGHRHARDRVGRVLDHLARRTVDDARRANAQALGQSRRHSEGCVVVRCGSHGRDGSASQALDLCVVAQLRDGVRVLQQEVEQAQAHGVGARDLHREAVQLHTANGHGVGDVEAATLAALGEEDAVVRGQLRPGLAVDGGPHAEGHGLRATLLRGGDQAVLVDLLHALVRVRPGELEERAVAQTRRPAVAHVAVEQIAGSAVVGRGGDGHAVRDDAHGRAQHHRRGEVQRVLRRIRVDDRDGEGVGALVQAVRASETHEHEGLEHRAGGGGGGRGAHSTLHVAAVHLDSVEVHDHAGAGAESQLIGVCGGIRGDGHLAAEEPHGLRHGGQRLGNGAPLGGEISHEPVLWDRAVGQVGPAGLLAAHDKAQREGNGAAEAHAAVGADGEGRAVGEGGGERHVGAIGPLDVVVVAKLKSVVALGQAEVVGLLARGDAR